VYDYALEMTKKEIHQAVEGLYHNLNTLQSRSGNQLPFSSINYGTCTLHEGRMIIEALLDVSIEGLGSTGKTSIFPCGIFQYMKGVNDKPGTPNYDMYRLALRSTAQRLYPNYANCNWSAQIDWYKKDREDKQQFIDNLSETDKNKLISMLEIYPEYKDILGLDIVK
jgi:ribonucleoside-triphosphate reductase